MPDSDLHKETQEVSSASVRVERPAEEAGHRPPTVPGSQQPPLGRPEETTNVGVDRGQVIGVGMKAVADWSLRFLFVAAALWVLWWILGKVWVGVLPVILALIVSTVLWPVVAFLRRKRVPAALATVITLLFAFGLVGGVISALAPSVASQSQEIFDQASEGIGQVQDWLDGPPLNLEAAQVESYVDQGIDWLREQSTQAAGYVASGVGAVGSALVTLAMVLVLTFFFLKDGPDFLPWLRRTAGRTAGRHLTEALTRVWNTLGGFIRTQAIVSAADAVLIGIGLLILQVPLALALAVLTFFGGFIPIVGAFIAGGLAILVALVTQGFTTAVWVLLLVLAVQQIEGNVLQPMLQGRSMQMHPGVILLAVAGGGTLFGIVGAFLAVPVAASVVVLLRYLSEQVDLRTGDLHTEDLAVTTPEGAVAAARAEHAAPLYRAMAAREEQQEERTIQEATTEERRRIRLPGLRRRGATRATGAGTSGERTSTDDEQDSPAR
ncbi:AI-2E family transporter [Ornithinimicrobium kibberense]|uniref:AI-2E family transporter n=2 Tax=Ornithinimicrobium kibberense TaxID=282060 RepID=A0ABV5V4I7_9MICO|nr:AI-2E family transporter [Ornithinimicrobium kibberense]